MTLATASTAQQDGASRTDWRSAGVGFLLLGVLVALVGWLVWSLWNAVTSLPAQVGAAAVTASATVLVSVVSLIVAKYFEGQRDIKQEHRRQKLPVYEEFISFMFDLLWSKKLGKGSITPIDIERFAADFAKRMLLVGSDDVLKHYMSFREVSASGGSTGIRPIVEWENLVYAMRRDLGHANKGLKQGQLLSLFINDVQKFIPSPIGSTAPSRTAKRSASRNKARG